LKAANLLEANTFSSSILLNKMDEFEIIALPKLAQISAIFGIVADDFDLDGKLDLVIAGNLYNSEVETPRNDAGQGLFLKGDGLGAFKPIRGYNSGLFIPGDVKKLKPIELQTSTGKRKGLLASLNSGNVILIMCQLPLNHQEQLNLAFSHEYSN
ncbi:MAG: hypothetical protein ACR2MX_18170, partial [Cyclobacteriaceae bacterium]